MKKRESGTDCYDRCYSQIRTNARFRLPKRKRLAIYYKKPIFRWKNRHLAKKKEIFDLSNCKFCLQKNIRKDAWIWAWLYCFQMSNEAAEFAMSKWRKLVDQLEAQSTRTKANSKKRLTNRGPFVYVDRRRYVEVQSFELLQGKTVP